MFIDEKTQIQIYANLDDSVINGTMRACDLIPAFMSVIRDTAEYAQLTGANYDWDMLVIFDAGADDNDDRWDSEDINYFLNEELFNVLDSYAPDGYYFGSHQGDGSNYGYWKNEN